jgi:hypothetical protein
MRAAPIRIRTHLDEFSRQQLKSGLAKVPVTRDYARELERPHIALWALE